MKDFTLTYASPSEIVLAPQTFEAREWIAENVIVLSPFSHDTWTAWP